MFKKDKIFCNIIIGMIDNYDFNNFGLVIFLE